MRFKARHLGKLLLMMVALAALGGIVMLLWNAVMPNVFVGARAIDYLQALGLLVLSRVLFGGFRGGGWSHGWHGGWRGHAGWRERWRSMTDEEREKFRRGMGERWRAGWHGDPDRRDELSGEGRGA